MLYLTNREFDTARWAFAGSVLVEHTNHTHRNIDHVLIKDYPDMPLSHCLELYIEVMPWKSYCEMQRLSKDKGDEI